MKEGFRFPFQRRTFRAPATVSIESQERSLARYSEEEDVTLTAPEFIASIPGDGRTFARELAGKLKGKAKREYEQTGKVEFYAPMSFDRKRREFKFLTVLDLLHGELLDPTVRRVIEEVVRDAARHYEDLTDVQMQFQIRIHKVGAYRETGEPGFHYDGTLGSDSRNYLFASSLPTEVLTGHIPVQERKALLVTKTEAGTLEKLEEMDAARSSLLPMAVYETGDVFHGVPESIFGNEPITSVETSDYDDDTPRVFIRILVGKSAPM